MQHQQRQQQSDRTGQQVTTRATAEQQPDTAKATPQQRQQTDKIRKSTAQKPKV